MGEGDTVLDRMIRRMAKLMLEEEPSTHLPDELSWLMQAAFCGSRAVNPFPRCGSRCRWQGWSHCR